MSLLTSVQYEERYLEMYGSGDPPPKLKKKSDLKISVLLWELSDDEDDGPMASAAPTDPQRPWIPGFELYLGTQDHLNGTSIVQWWGVSLLFLSARSTSRNQILDECASPPCVGVTCGRLPVSDGLIHVKQACIFCCWPHDYQVV